MNTNTIEIIVVIQIFLLLLTWFGAKIIDIYLIEKKDSKNIVFMFFRWLFRISCVFFLITILFLIITYIKDDRAVEGSGGDKTNGYCHWNNNSWNNNNTEPCFDCAYSSQRGDVYFCK